MNEEDGGRRDIQERLHEYALRAIRVYRELEKKREGAGRILGSQFLRAATSVGACMQEATSAESTADFIHKCAVAQKEARESLYWLRLIRDAGMVREDQVKPLVDEADEVLRIITKIIVNTKSNRASRGGVHS